jgi:hypothetical protein
MTPRNDTREPSWPCPPHPLLVQSLALKCLGVFEPLTESLLARVTGLEPATSGVTGRRSNQLSYTRSDGRVLKPREPSVKRPCPRDAIAARASAGIDLSLEKLVGGDGFEPPALSV